MSKERVKWPLPRGSDYIATPSDAIWLLPPFLKSCAPSAQASLIPTKTICISTGQRGNTTSRAWSQKSEPKATEGVPASCMTISDHTTSTQSGYKRTNSRSSQEYEEGAIRLFL